MPSDTGARWGRDEIAANDMVEIRDAYDKVRRAIAVTGVEGTHNDEGRKIHDFPVVWIATFGTTTDNPIVKLPWPAEDVRLAPEPVRDDFSQIEAEMEALRGDQ